MIKFERICCNLRTSDWRRVDYRDLKARISEEHASGEDSWKCVPWQQERSHWAHRSFLVMSQGGGLFAIFIRRTHT